MATICPYVSLELRSTRLSLELPPSSHHASSKEHLKEGIAVPAKLKLRGAYIVHDRSELLWLHCLGLRHAINDAWGYPAAHHVTLQSPAGEGFVHLIHLVRILALQTFGCCFKLLI